MIDFSNVKQWNIGNNEVIKAELNNVVVWEKPSVVDYTIPLYIENITDEVETVTIKRKTPSQSASTPIIDVYKSEDMVNWGLLGSTSNALSISLNPGDRVYLRALATTWATGSEECHIISGMSKVGGNIMSLLYGANFTGNERSFPTGSTFTFNRLFEYNVPGSYIKGLRDASELLLPATTMTWACYSSLFYQNSRLTYMPATLPATILAGYCYDHMFGRCCQLTDYSLTVKAPILSVATLVEGCYGGMFNGCTYLNHVECLVTDISASNCVYGWLSNVAASGTFVKHPNMTSWPSGASGIPSGWTVEDANI